jgi:predicted amidophosphoribosyltransferase
MARYRNVEENWEDVGGFDGLTIDRPKYRCQKCSRAIKEEYLKTSGECYDCNNGEIEIGEFIQRVHAVTVYVPDAKNTDLMEGIYDLKDELENVSKFAAMLEWAVKNDNDLESYDLIVVPPSADSSSTEKNHMVPVAEELSAKVDIPFRDIIYSKSDHPSQKSLEFDERKENVQGKIGCREKDLQGERVIILDDIATSCSTLSETAKAVIESGASEAKGLVIARDESLRNLEFAGAIQKVENDD